MLVLGRKVGESVVIGDGVVVKVLGLHGRQIRLGIEAPPAQPILRGELVPEEVIPEQEGSVSDGSGEARALGPGGVRSR